MPSRFSHTADSRLLPRLAIASQSVPHAPPTSSPNGARAARASASTSAESRAPLMLILRVAEETDSETDEGALGGAESTERGGDGRLQRE